MKRMGWILIFLGVLGGIFFYVAVAWQGTHQVEEQLKQAYAAYVRGETAETIGKREDAFNEALKIYTGLENEFRPDFGNGKLDYNIGNTYFQVEEYPSAVLYYYRALKLMPRDERAKNNLHVVLEKLGVTEKKEKSAFEKLFFFHNMLSVPERLQLLTLLAVLAFLFYSLYIWLCHAWLAKVGGAALFLSAVLLLSVGYTHYFEPVEAVVIHATALYRDAGFQYAKVLEEPILSGRKVVVLDVVLEGKWLKVLSSDGTLGYAPAESLRII